MKIVLSPRSQVRALTAFLLIFSLFPLGPISVAQAESGLSVAWVDIKRAVWESRAGKSAQKELKSEFEDAQSDINSKSKELERLKSNLDSKRESLKLSAVVAKEEELIEKEKSLKRRYVDSKEALRRKEGLMKAKLITGIRKIANEIGKEKKYTLILEAGNNASVLYADSSIDITDEVIKRMNKSS